MTNESDRLMNQSEAAVILAVSARTLEKWRVKGGGPLFVKVGSSVRYRFCDLQAWIASNARAHTASVTARVA